MRAGGVRPARPSGAHRPAVNVVLGDDGWPRGAAGVAPTGPRSGCPASRSRPGSPTRDGDLGNGRLLLLPGDRGPDLEDAVLVACGDVLVPDALGKRDVADEGAVPELRPVHVLALLLRLLLPVRLDVEHAVVDGQLDVPVGVDVGQLGPHDQRALVDELLDTQPTGVHIEVGHATEHLGNLEPEPLGKVEALPAHQCHGCLLSRGGHAPPSLSLPTWCTRYHRRSVTKV